MAATEPRSPRFFGRAQSVLVKTWLACRVCRLGSKNGVFSFLVGLRLSLFGVSHLSEVWGVRLADGREVVVKRRADDAGRTASCGRAQRVLAERGFPCPLPLTEVIFEDGVATHAEQFV